MNLVHRHRQLCRHLVARHLRRAAVRRASGGRPTIPAMPPARPRDPRLKFKAAVTTVVAARALARALLGGERAELVNFRGP